MARTKRTTVQPIDHHNLGAQMLFAAAKSRIEDILNLMGQYNEIRDSLEALGYGGESSPEKYVDMLSEDYLPPVPYVQIMANGNNTVDHSRDLDRYYDAGPQRRTAIIQRVPLTSERNRLGKDSGWTCFYCSNPGSRDFGPDGRVWHVDHCFPVSRGGDDEADNHVLACATCNLDKRTKTALEYFKERAIREINNEERKRAALHEVASA